MGKLFSTGNADVEYDKKYSKKIQKPQYIPTNVKPNIMSLYNYDKYAKLIKSINESNVSDEEKKFLKVAAHRHIVFNYAKIADYYAHASKEMQELMEQSALVILDMNDAIANGYVTLSVDVKNLLDECEAMKDE